MANAEYKPLLFTTTMRNPARLKQMLYILNKFDGCVLTNSLAVQIVGECIRYGIYRPNIQLPSVRKKWKTSPKGTFGKELLTDKEVEYMLNANPQKHKEAGFERGYPSRFATMFGITMQLGLAYCQPELPIYISPSGHRLINVLDVTVEDGDVLVEETHPEYETEVFLHAFAKYQRNNPFIKVLNDNVPLILLIETIRLLDADPEFNGAGISRKELPLLIFWKNNDSRALYSRIKELRRLYGYNPSDEVIIDICVNEIMEGNYKKFDEQSIVRDYPDEFIRKMRMTGLISLRGSGRFVDINHNEDKRVDYVLEHYSHYPHFTDKRAYFDYMAEPDSVLSSIESAFVPPSKSEELLKEWVEVYSWEVLRRELEVLAARRSSTDEVLRILAAPVRLEFLAALAIKSKLPHVRVIPSYSADDTGLPTSTAGGGMADIECRENSKGILVEVTMSQGRTQTIMEIWPIERHLLDFKEETGMDAQSIFVAPSIFSDSVRQIGYISYDSAGQTIIRPYSIREFIAFLETTAHLYAE